MGHDAAYRTSAYVAAKRSLRGQRCHICGAPSDTVDHDPPLSSFPDWRSWKGRLRPACRRCQNRQGGRVVHNPVRLGTPSRSW